MSFSTGYRGAVGGSVQTKYTDQPGEGIPGMLAFASDINLADAVYMGEVDGIAAGRGVIFQDVVDVDFSLQRPNVSAFLPTIATNPADFKGIVVFDERMNSDANGIPGWANGRVGRILRNNRSGGRIYVNCPLTVTLADSVFMQVVADADYEVGEFRPTDAPDITHAIEIPNAKWITPLFVDVGEPAGIAMIELLG